MCLGVPGRVVAVTGLRARVDFWGVEREVGLELLEVPVVPGDFVVSHVGRALRRIPDEEVGPTLALYDELLAELEREDRGEAPAGSAGRRERR